MAPPAPAAVIACCSDSATPGFRRVVRAIRREDPDVVLFAGDARADGFGIGRMRGLRWRRTWGPLAARVLTVPGNHDYRPGSPEAWWWDGDWAGSPAFSRNSAGGFVLHLPSVSVLGLSSGPQAREVGGDQLTWARDAFDSPFPGPRRIAVVHAPPFPVGEHIGSSLDADADARDRLWAALEDLGVELVLSGHEHLYARRTIRHRRAIVQIVSAGAGAKVAPALASDLDASNSTHHAVVLSVGPRRFSGTAVTAEGEVLDRFFIDPGRAGAEASSE